MPLEVSFVGIDLAAVNSRNTGLAILSNNNIRVYTLHKDWEILKLANGKVIAIDAPLFLPIGIKRIHKGMPLRACDKELVNLNIRFFPIQFGSMRILTKRGIKLKERLSGEVIETYPGAVYKLSNLSRSTVAELLKKKFNVSPRNKDEVDAIVCALVAKAHYLGMDIEIGDTKEGLMHLIDLNKFLSKF